MQVYIGDCVVPGVVKYVIGDSTWTENTHRFLWRVYARPFPFKSFPFFCFPTSAFFLAAVTSAFFLGVAFGFCFPFWGAFEEVASDFGSCFFFPWPDELLGLGGLGVRGLGKWTNANTKTV